MTSLLIRAMRGEPVERTPVWLMRQAGRYMAEYRTLRERYSILEIIEEPDLAAEVTLQPVRKFSLDAAIIFADILPPLRAMGLDLEFAAGEGPVISNPVRTVRDIDLLAAPPAAESMPFTLEAIRRVKRELSSKGTPLIGFAGAPFTLASYAIEGGTSRNFTRTKALMYREPAAWKRLMTKLVTVQTDYLAAQAEAGADALQLFDSWAGIALGRPDYNRFVRPYNSRLFESLRRTGVPVINFSTGTSAYIEDVAACGGDVIGVDWRLPLGEIRSRLGPDRPVQGNLDPVALTAPWRELQYQIREVLSQAKNQNGHVFNLGHGILPETPVENVQRLLECVREESSRGRRLSETK
ncbi:MAG TPA: uroporphyrinogen decarboxylase [Spirochaetia bacterium]|nr:uroporphyrinogen decarboxylase [Spirochaetia bacterium]